MAVTRIGDVIVPHVFQPYVIEQSTEKTAIFQSGIVQPVPGITVPAGDSMSMPFWNDLEGDLEAIQSNHTLTPGKIDAQKDLARILQFGKAWSAEDFASEMAGANAQQTIAGRVGNYWGRQMQKVVLSFLDGVFASNVANNSGDLVYNAAVSDPATETPTADNNVNGEHIIDAAQLLGDAKDKFTAIAMHSRVHSNLQKQSLIEFIPDDQANVGWGTYMGKSVVVDDGLAPEDVADGVKEYTTYLFAAGAVGYAEGSVLTPVETDRNSLGGEDILINRRRFILHPRGFKWTEGSVAGDMPTVAELREAANHQRVYDKKNTRVVKMVSNG